MSDLLDEFCLSLQEQMDRQVERQYGPEVAEVWRNLRYFNVLESGDGEGRITGQCEDTIEVFIKVRQGRIEEISYWTDGCVATVVCGSVVCDMALGKPLEEAEEISGEDILKRFPHMPPDHKHCAFLAASALHEAIGDYYQKARGE